MPNPLDSQLLHYCEFYFGRKRKPTVNGEA